MLYSVKIQQIVPLISRILGVVYIAILFVIDMLIVPVNQQTIDALINNIRDIFLYYSFIAVLYCCIRYKVELKDKNLNKIPDSVKRKIVVLFVVGVLWIFMVDFASATLRHSFADCPRILIWFFDSIYFIPFVFPFRRRCVSCDDSVCCESSRMVIECTFIILLLICLSCAVANCSHLIKNNDVATQSQGERLSPPVINRKTPSAHCRKMLEVTTLERHVVPQIESDVKMSLRVSAEDVDFGTSLAELASEKNQVMDDLLNRPQIPPDYGDVMIELYRDKSQDVLTRDFAVQHIGLYAQTLERRGEYDADTAESRKLRAVLCGERRIGAARSALEAICADAAASEILRRSALRALASIEGAEVAQ